MRATETADAESCGCDPARLGPGELPDIGSLERRVRQQRDGCGRPRCDAQLLRAAGLAARRLADLDASERYFREGIAIAEDAGARYEAADAAISLAGTLALGGDFDGALVLLDQQAASAPEALRNQAVIQKGGLQLLRGTYADAVVTLDTAEQRLTDADSTEWRARLHANRGTCLDALGRLEHAAADFETAYGLNLHLERWAEAAAAVTHTGLALAKTGQVNRAMEAFDRADELAHKHNVRDPRALLDRAKGLRLAGLFDEAADAAARSAEEITSDELAIWGFEAHLVLAGIEWDRGRFDDAAAHARTASAAFDAAGIGATADRARALELLARWRAGEATEEIRRAMVTLAPQLETNGHATTPRRLRLASAVIGRTIGTNASAAAQLRLAGRGTGGTIEDEVLRLQASAQRALWDGDLGRVREHVVAGVALTLHHQASVGGLDLRSTAAWHGAEIAHIGVRAALDLGDGRDLLAASEALRAASLSMPAPPSNDPEVIRALDELRALYSANEHREAIGRAERAIRDRHRRADGVRSTWHMSAIDGLDDMLGDRCLVEFVETGGGNLAGVLVDRSRYTTFGVGRTDDIRVPARSISAAAPRILRGRASAASVATADAGIRADLAQLDTLLFGELDMDFTDRDVVIVPTPDLTALPWSAFPRLRRSSTRVAPSASMWLRGSRQSLPEKWWVGSGPGLPESQAEITAIADLHGTTARPEVTVAELQFGMVQADGVHLACHGHHRADNPLFSSLQLADGPITIYDLVGVSPMPSTVVLSACDAARSRTIAHSEQLGIALSFLRLGASTVVAATGEVEDGASRRLMVDFHTALTSSGSVSEALATARLAAAGRGIVDEITAGRFIAIGGG